MFLVSGTPTTWCLTGIQVMLRFALVHSMHHIPDLCRQIEQETSTDKHSADTKQKRRKEMSIPAGHPGGR
jgi:hypothetical protein